MLGHMSAGYLQWADP